MISINNTMNIISNTASVRLFLVIRMAEGVACVDRNGSFDNEAACTYRVRVDLQDGLARLKKRPDVSTPTGAIVEALRLWDIPGTYLEFPRLRVLQRVPVAASWVSLGRLPVTF